METNQQFKLDTFQLVSRHCISCTPNTRPLLLVGVPFLIAGVMVTLLGFDIIHGGIQTLPVWARPIIIFGGILFSIIGIVVIFGKWRILIDAERGTITKIFKFGILLRKRNYPLRNYSELTLKFESGNGDTADVYELSLQPRLEEKKLIHLRRDLPIYSSILYSTARAEAEKVAKFLSFPLKDTVEDSQIRT